MVDLGHIWHTKYWNTNLDSEAIALIVQYGFGILQAEGFYAGNPIYFTGCKMVVTKEKWSNL